MHGLIRDTFRLASVMAIVFVDLVLKVAFPQTVIAHGRLPLKHASNGHRRMVGMLGRTACSTAGAACEFGSSCIVDSNDGYAASLPEREQKPAGCCHASEVLDRERFAAGALRESGTREPRRRSEVDKVYRARRSANLKTCKQCGQVFLRGMRFRHRGGRDRRQSASAASESVLGPEIPVFYGGCLFHDRILDPATGPSDRSRA